MSVRHHKKLQLTPLALAFVVAGFTFPLQSLAQVEEDAATSEDVLEEVIVTGSRIRRPDNLSSVTPMVTLGQDQIEMTGSINVYDILNELPQAGEGTTRGNSNFTVGSSGLQTVDLRGLGASRTLTLVNGRRWVGGVPGSNVVDLNSIPSDLIQRVEVVTGGASSIYGSDAVAGVVNLILKDDYEGIDVEVMGGQYGEGDGETYAASLMMGSNFADGRGNAMFYVRYDEQGDVMARDRAPNTGSDVFYYGYYYGAAYGAPYDTLLVDPAYSSYPPQGRFFISGSNQNSRGMLTFDCSERDEDSVLPSDNIVDWAEAGGSNQCGFNRTYHRRLEVPLDRYSTFGKITYNMNEDHQAFMEVSYTSVDSVSELEPFPLSSEDIFGGLGTFGYHYTNPYVPQEIADAAVAANADNPDWNGQIPFIRRLQEVGNRGSHNTRDTFRLAFGMQGSFGNIDYDWYYQYGEANRVQTSSGAFNAMNFRAALDAEYDALGNIVCASEIDRSAGCVPINVFGMGAITPEAADWVSYETMRISNNTQEVTEFNLTSEFELFGSPISWAAGMQYRKESSDDNPDDLQEQGLTGGNVVPRTKGKYDVLGGYAEFLVPLIHDVPFIQDLTLELAYRIDDYSTAGKVDAAKLGLNWTLNDQFRVRAVLAQSVRAPDINDLFQGQAQTFSAIGDPCTGLGTANEPNMDPIVVANCYSIPSVAATAAEGSYNPDTGETVPGFLYSQPDIQTISGFIGGNEDLFEETADTITAGFVWTPGYLEGLALSVDYYNIEIEDVISSVSATQLINECYSTPGLDDFQCDAHERFSETGKLRYWYSFGINQSVLKSEGVDVAASYRFDKLWLIPGTLNATMLWTHRLKHEFQTTADSTPVDSVGEVGYNDDKVKFTLVWLNDKWLVSLDDTWYSSALDDVTVAPDAYSLNKVGSINYLDTQVRFMPSESWQFYVGVDNILDQDPPFCPNCKHEPSPGSFYTGSQYRPWSSRFFYGGIRYSFN